MPQRTRVVILMAVTTVFAAVVLAVVRVLTPDAFARYLREFGGLLIFGWVAVLVPMALERLGTRRARSDGASEALQDQRTRLTAALAVVVAGGALVAMALVGSWWRYPALAGGGTLVGLLIWHLAGRR